MEPQGFAPKLVDSEERWVCESLIWQRRIITSKAKTAHTNKKIQASASRCGPVTTQEIATGTAKIVSGRTTPGQYTRVELLSPKVREVTHRNQAKTAGRRKFRSSAWD
jgi:hypothetical protein